VEVRVTAKNTETLKIEFPEFNIDNENITLSTFSFNDTSLVLSLQFWQSGVHEIPSMEIQLFSEDGKLNTFSTEPIIFDILERPATLDTTLRISKNNKNIYLPIGLNQLILICIIILSIIAIYKLFKRKHKQVLLKPFTQKIDIYIKAKNELNDLPIPENMLSDELEAFYISLANTLKTYLLRKFFFNAINMTSSEIIMYLKTHKIPIEGLNDLLCEADLCKFAKKKYGVTTIVQAKKTAQRLLLDFENKVI